MGDCDIYMYMYKKKKEKTTHIVQEITSDIYITKLESNFKSKFKMLFSKPEKSYSIRQYNYQEV